MNAKRYGSITASMPQDDARAIRLVLGNGREFGAMIVAAVAKTFPTQWAAALKRIEAEKAAQKARDIAEYGKEMTAWERWQEDAKRIEARSKKPL